MKQPNILVFMADHYRFDMAPPYNRAITPNLDKIKDKSVIFTETYCVSPHCCPSRASFFTGLYPSEHGVWNNVHVGNCLSQGLYKDTPLFTDYIKQSGYDMYYTGKWHISAFETPAERGFTTGHLRCVGIDEDNRIKPNMVDWERYETSNISREEGERRYGEIKRPGFPEYFLYGTNENPFEDEFTVNSAIELIRNRKNKDKPFFQFVGVESPHDSYCPPKRFLDYYKLEDIELPASFYDDMKDKPHLYSRTRDRFAQLSELEYKEGIRHFLAFCTYVDYSFGRVMDALAETGQLEDTIVLFTSDHADYVGEHGLWAKGLPCFNGAYHVPAVFYYEKGFGGEGKVYDNFVSTTDFAPTFAELCGLDTNIYSGNSLVPFLKGEEPKEWRDTVFTQSNGNEIYGIQRSAMTKDWKYIFNSFDYDELYDLKNDPDQMHNLINDEKYKGVVRQLCRKIWDFNYKHKDTSASPYIMTSLMPYGPKDVW